MATGDGSHRVPEMLTQSERNFRGRRAVARRRRDGYRSRRSRYRRACLNAIEYLTKFGYSPEQAYLLLGAAPIEGRFSGVVDIPNSCATLYLPACRP